MSQLSLWGSGDTLRDAGMATTELANADFIRTMRAKAIEIAKAKGVVTSDDLRKHAQELQIGPSHPNAWGALFRVGKTWRVVGRIKSKLSSNHSREIRVWALVAA